MPKAAGSYLKRIPAMNPYHGDILQYPMQQAAGIARARAVFLSTIDADRLRAVPLYLRERYADLGIYAWVRTLEEQEALPAKGIKHAATTYLESTLFHGGSLLRGMGVVEEQTKILIDSLRKDDDQLIRDAFSKTQSAAAVV